MDISQRLDELWNADYIDDLPLFKGNESIKERGYAFFDNREKKDLLITGFNPSFREGESKGNICLPTTEILRDTHHDNYWSRVRKMLHDQEIDLRSRATYLDIFYFRETGQTFLKSKLLRKPEGIRFIVDQLNLTMHTIEEVIQPKVIVVKNKESSAYFGKEADTRGWIWMGYALKQTCNTFCGEVWEIKGLIDSPERIAPEITQTSLVGTLVLFTSHITQYTKRGTIPTTELLYDLLRYHSEGMDSFPKEYLYPAQVQTE